MQNKGLDCELNKKSKEVVDLQARVTADDHRDEVSRREAFALKQKIVATEASREQALKEVCHFCWLRFREAAPVATRNIKIKVLKFY